MSFNNYRLLEIKYNTLGKARKDRLQSLKRLKQNQNAFQDRNLKIKYQFSPARFTIPFELTLIGYDGGAKYSSNRMSQAELNRIYRIIDQMPMRQAELRGGNMDLFTDKNPKTTLKGTGFKDAKKAKETLRLIKDRPKIYQFQVVNTMYNRAKHHPYQTKEMKDAMKIYARWLSNYKSKK